MYNSSQLVLLVGRSGSGKDYLCKTLGLNTVVSYCTRPMRQGEVNGREHVFVDDAFFKDVQETKVLLAYTCRDSYHFWTTMDDVEGRQVYIIDPAGVKYFKEKYAGKMTVKVVLLKVSLMKRIRNMHKRGDSWRNIYRRIRIDRSTFLPFEQSGNYDYMIKL